MGLLKAAGEPGWLKAGFLGFPGSGKTVTATRMAIAARREMGLDGPIAFFDTEDGTPFVADMVQRATGRAMGVVKSRSLDDLKATVKECIDGGVSVLVVDSITHVWREVCDTYLRRVNANQKARGRDPFEKLEFQHWSAVKGPDLWGGWTDLFLTAPLNIVICGRAGYEYDMERDERTGRRDLIKVGVKMRVEGEFGFEPSLVVEMDAEQVMNGDRVTRIDHNALVLKDRNPDAATSLVGKTFRDPTGEEFLPHVRMLRPKAHVPLDPSKASNIVIHNVARDPAHAAELARREEIMEEVGAALEAAGLGGTGNEAKQGRSVEVLAAFGTGSKTKMEAMPSAELAAGLARLRESLAKRAAGAKETSK